MGHTGEIVVKFVQVFESDLGRENGPNRAAQLPQPKLPFDSSCGDTERIQLQEGQAPTSYRTNSAMTWLGSFEHGVSFGGPSGDHGDCEECLR